MPSYAKNHPQEYTAPKPTYTNWNWFKFFALRIVFPPIIAWDILKLTINKVFGKFIGKIILPAQNDLYTTDASYDEFDDECDDEISICSFTIHTHDKVNLDSVEIKNTTSSKQPISQQKFIINLVGNGMCYENITDELIYDAIMLKANTIGFNFRGVSKSTGAAISKDGLVTDGIAQVQRLLDQGVQPENIILKGHSLGAGVGALVADHFHQNGIPIKLFSSRSFSSLTDVVVGQIQLKRDSFGDARGQQTLTENKMLAWLAKPILKIALSLLNWEINALASFKRIPQTDREYVVLRSKKEHRGKHYRINRYDDQVIPHSASIHKGLAAERKEAKKQRKNMKNNYQTVLKDLVQRGNYSAATNVVNNLDKMGCGQKMEASDDGDMLKGHIPNGHNEPLHALFNRQGTDGLSFFYNFVNSAEPNQTEDSSNQDNNKLNTVTALSK